ncbi:MAG: glucose-6-phosphate isomerase [Pseudomonadota bacterium]
MPQSTDTNAPDALPNSDAWQALNAACQRIKQTQPHIAGYFENDSNRFDRFSLSAAGILLDYSKNQLTEEILTLLLKLAERAGMQPAIASMFDGEIINNTEQRPALHVALRSQKQDTDFEKEAHAALNKMEAFVQQVQSGTWKGYTGHVITDVVNIGIGGSDLGPAMVYQALSAEHLAHIKCHFVSNVDPVHLEQTLKNLQPAHTLFVIASKTFTTMETSLNSQAARAWILAAGASDADLSRHFVAVSANIEKAAAFGIDPQNIFPMWNWVGGRYSLWSAIGLPVALGIGMANFRALLKGASMMDEHFRTAPLAQNLPVVMALLNLWYFNFWQAESQAILPYAQNLHLFPSFLQQLDMESLGKQVRKDGQTLITCSGGIVWGSAGTNGQHSFHQLLHQGTHLIPADFIAIADSVSENREQHEQLLANCFAQSQALMNGKSLAQAKVELLKQGLSDADAAALAPHKVIPGNRPSNTLLLAKLNPESLGALTALYEHKVYAQSVLLQINAFDQWGVELGKVLSTDIYKAVTAKTTCTSFDASTNALINKIKKS